MNFEQLLGMLLTGGPSPAPAKAMEPLPIRKSVDIFADDRTGGSVLHVPSGKMDDFVREVADFIERRIREMNAEDPQAAKKLLCGGCVLAISQNICTEFVLRSHATIDTLVRVRSSMAKDFDRDALSAMEAGFVFGGSAQISGPLPEGVKA